MLLVFILWIKDLILGIFRNFYWLWRLSSVQKGNRFRCRFPVIIEGKGKITVGNDANWEKNINLGCGANSSLTFGKRSRLDEGLYMRIGGKAKVYFGDETHLEGPIKIYTDNDWIVGNQVTFASGCAIYHRESGQSGQFTVGNGTYVGNNTIIDLSESVKIGENVAIGPNCIIYTHDHDYNENQEIPWKGRPIRKPVAIEDGVWIGSGVTILPGIRIGKGVVVAAGAVVTKDIKDYDVVFGVPAKAKK